MKKNKSLRIRSEKLRLVLKWGLYLLLALLCYVFMTTSPGTGVKPLLLIPVALCIAMWESEMPSALTGVICGLLLDSACGKVMGYNGLMLMALCLFVSLLFLHLMRQNFVNSIFVVTISSILLGVLDFFFYHGIWGYDRVELIFWDYTLPSVLLTILSTVPVYFIVKIIYIGFDGRQEPHIEEKSESIVRE